MTVVGIVKLLKMLEIMVALAGMDIVDNSEMLVALAIMAGMLVERNPLSMESSL